MLDLSISIVNWNTKDLLEQCLHSIYTCVGNIHFEVFVVDNGSSDDSAEMVKNKFPQVRLIQNTLNPGFAAANNQAIRQSQGRHVLILNSDTIIQPDSIDASVAFLNANIQAGAVGVKTLQPDGSMQPTWGGFPSLGSELLGHYPLKGIPVKVPAGNGVYKEVLETNSLAGSYLMVRREAIDKVGLMDESFYMYSEEIDWCFRLRKKGYKLYYLPYVHIIHFLGQSTKQRDSEMKIHSTLQEQAPVLQKTLRTSIRTIITSWFKNNFHR